MKQTFAGLIIVLVLDGGAYYIFNQRTNITQKQNLEGVATTALGQCTKQNNNFVGLRIKNDGLGFEVTFPNGFKQTQQQISDSVYEAAGNNHSLAISAENATSTLIFMVNPAGKGLEFAQKYTETTICFQGKDTVVNLLESYDPTLRLDATFVNDTPSNYSSYSFKLLCKSNTCNKAATEALFSAIVSSLRVTKL